ncbi:MAG: glycosyltransferase family 2 protein [Proteobacteria bacterium]|nr:glycosyltransferase family 2 protein [Pseudomonadota bacterium]
MNQQPLLSVVILTHNEAANLPVCLKSLAGLGAAIFVVDSGSTDDTVEIARQAGCAVLEHPFENYARQLNWALDSLPLDTPFVMRLDADESLTPELAQELATRLPTLPDQIGGLMLKRRVYFWGRFIRHGGYYPTWLLRIWRRGQARCEERWMDEHMVLVSGELGRLQHDIIDENHKGLSFWTDKHNRYADREVLDMLALARPGAEDIPAGQAGRRRWAKVNLYAKSPPFLRALLYFLYRYVARLGFLDGVPGLVFHFLQGFWYRFLVDAKLYEAKRKGGRHAS